MIVTKLRHRLSGWTLPLLLGILCVSLALVQPACAPSKDTEPGIQPPVAKQIPKELTIHGDTRVDNYYWLNERDNPDVIAYLEAENAYTEAVMKPTEALQEKLFEEIVGRIQQTDLSVPYKSHGYFYYTRYVEGGEYPIYCRKKGSLEAEEEILLDANAMAEGHDFFSVTGLSVSANNNLLAYGVDTVSRRMYTLHFKDLATGEILPDEIVNTSGSAAWANDNKTVFYTLKEEGTLRPFKIFKHVLGTPISQDELLFHEKDETFNVYAYKTKSDEYIFIISGSTLSTEFRYLDADTPSVEFQILQPREKDLEYMADHYQDKFFIYTNLDAKNFRLMTAPVENPTKENWTELIPHRDDVFLEGFELFEDFLVLEERKNGLTEIRIKPWEGGEEHYLDFGEETYSAGVSTNREFDRTVESGSTNGRAAGPPSR